jgi:hypothetical protein
MHDQAGFILVAVHKGQRLNGLRVHALRQNAGATITYQLSEGLST